MLSLLNLATTALASEAIDEPERRLPVNSNFQRQYSGLFTYDIVTFYQAAQQLRLALIRMTESDQLDDFEHLIDESIRHGIIDRLMSTLETRVVASGPMVQWLSLAQFEALQIISCALKGTYEQISVIARSGVHIILSRLVEHPSAEVRLTVLKALSVIAELPESESGLFETFLLATKIALRNNEFAILLHCIKALDSFYVSHRWLPWERLYQALPLLQICLTGRNVDLERLCLIFLRNITNSSGYVLRPLKAFESGEIHLPGVQEKISLVDAKASHKSLRPISALPNLNPYISCKAVYDSDLVLNLIRLMSSNDQGVAHEAAMVLRNMLKVLPEHSEKLLDFGLMQGLFDVLTLLNVYNDQQYISLITKAKLELLHIIGFLCRKYPRAADDVKRVQERQRFQEEEQVNQGISLIIEFSSCRDSAISVAASDILKCVFASALEAIRR